MINELSAIYPLQVISRVRLLLTLILLPALCGCGNLYTGDETPVVPETPGGNADNSEAPVMVAFCDPIYNILTRGTGVIDPSDANNYSDRMQKGLFFIYAFRRDNVGENVYTTHRLEDVHQRYCLVDGSCDEPMMQDANNPGKDKNGYPYLSPEQCKEHGKRARYAGNGSFVNWTSTTNAPYYNVQQQLDPFNFFAYYYDDAKIGDVQRDRDRISFDVTIDGSQDLMCAAATNLEALIGEIEKNPNKNYGDYQELANRLKQLQADELKTVKSYYYSTYTARFNLWPIIRMQHQMAYVKVKFTPAQSLIDKPEDMVYIRSVKLEVVCKGTFTVASYDLTRLGASFPENGERTNLPAREVDGSIKKWMDEENNYLHLVQLPSVEGGIFLAPPGNNARLIIETIYYPEGDKSKAVTSSVAHDLKDIVYNKDTNGSLISVGFMRGRMYSINASVYGPQDIRIDVQPASWVNGGEFDIDIEDGEFEN